MTEISRTAHDMISKMTPTLRPGVFAFVTTTDDAQAAVLEPEAIASFKEDEGVSLIVPAALAAARGLETDQPMCCITLNVYSSLEGVGLTAAVSAALGAKGIPCNMVAAYHHDHAFVPADRAEEAMQVLRALQARTAKGG